ncbi:ATP synthase mitochondrial F1 complex assembly factor 2 [Polyrhizophydium stewartii]|uniref:ATP synthase mitochondrial F1 complex assembly factor 2 n=1 Tax=Polyrhizophydium stewartii TaxID=2732419 RepID=A0ABR4N0K6_9FUNG|nr:ATP synthase complex assembly protein atp12 [Polyrhizophydium stewartii]
MLGPALRSALAPALAPALRSAALPRARAAAAAALASGSRLHAVRRYLSSPSAAAEPDAAAAAVAAAAEAETAAAEQKPPRQFNRFWKSVTLGVTSTGFTVLLDGRALKTPDGHQVLIPLNRPVLAALTAAEWEGQEKILKSFSLPLTSIVVRAIDSFTDAEIRKGVIDGLLKYVHTDSVCYRQPYPDSFVKLQEQYWTPLVDWLKRAYGLDIVTTDGILSIQQSDEVMAKLRSIVEAYDNVKLAAFEKAVLRSKSFIIALALMEREINVDFAATAGRLEVIHQIERWGEVEDSHDTDREDLKRQLGSVACVIASSL